MPFHVGEAEVMAERSIVGAIIAQSMKPYSRPRRRGGGGGGGSGHGSSACELSLREESTETGCQSHHGNEPYKNRLDAHHFCYKYFIWVSLVAEIPEFLNPKLAWDCASSKSTLNSKAYN